MRFLGLYEIGGVGGVGGNRKKLHARPIGVNDGGHVVGEDHHRAKLTDHDVWLIHELKAEGLTYRQIAAKFDISKAQVGHICTGFRRGHVVTGQRST